LSIFCHHRCIRKIINSLPLRRKLLRNFLLRVRSNKVKTEFNNVKPFLISSFHRVYKPILLPSPKGVMVSQRGWHPACHYYWQRDLQCRPEVLVGIQKAHQLEAAHQAHPAKRQRNILMPNLDPSANSPGGKPGSDRY
jgi:hypothetical protein